MRYCQPEISISYICDAINAHADEESNLLQTGLNGSVWLAGEGVLASLGQETVGKVQSQPKMTK